jgi:hypothetical protein
MYVQVVLCTHIVYVALVGWSVALRERLWGRRRFHFSLVVFCFTWALRSGMASMDGVVVPTYLVGWSGLVVEM